MKRSATFIPIIHDKAISKEAEFMQHLIRGGFIRKSTDGVFSILPLGKRILSKLIKGITEELEKQNGMEISLSTLKNVQENSLNEMTVHDNMFQLQSNNDESIISLIQEELDEAINLPLVFYQIDKAFQWNKSGKGFPQPIEYLLNEVFVLSSNDENGEVTKENLLSIYKNMLHKLGLSYSIVQGLPLEKAESQVEEIIIISEEGNETILYSDGSNYAANVTVAEIGHQEEVEEELNKELEKFAVEKVKDIHEVLEERSLTMQNYLKADLYKIDGEFTLVVTRGDHIVNEWKLKKLLQAEELKLADARQVKKLLNCSKGYVGPIKLPLDIKVVADLSVKNMQNCLSGANEEGYFYKNVNPNKDFAVNIFGDIRYAEAGDLSPNDEGRLFAQKGFKIGEICHYPIEEQFQLTSIHINLTQLFIILAQKYHDNKGLLFPKEVASFQIHLIVKNVHRQAELNLADELYNILSFYQFEVLYDERDVEFERKMMESDLIGSPVKLIIGERAEEGFIDLTLSNDNQMLEFSKEALIDWLTDFFRVE